MTENESPYWLELLERLALLLESTPAGERVATFLATLRTEFRWPVVEYWVLDDTSFYIETESHDPTPLLDDFIEKSLQTRVHASMTAPIDYDPAAQRRVSWGNRALTSPRIARPELIRAASLATLVAIPVPSDGITRRFLILRDFPPREREPEHERALAIAAFFFGRLFQSADSERVLSPGISGLDDVDPRSRSIVGPLGTARLTVYEWDLLSVLLEHEGDVISFETLIQEVWRAPAEYVGRAVVYEVVGRLRARITAVGSQGLAIISVPRVGYRLTRKPPPGPGTGE